MHSPLHFTELRFWFCNWLRWKICLCRFVFYPLHKTNLKKVHTPRYHLKTPQNFGVQREGSGGGRVKAAVSWPLLSFDQPSLQVQSQQNSQINVERHRLRHAEYRAALMGNECHSRVQSSCHHALTLKMENPIKTSHFTECPWNTGFFLLDCCVKWNWLSVLHNTCMHSNSDSGTLKGCCCVTPTNNESPK